jgi:plasmid maintenance system antidote protein VapI
MQVRAGRPFAEEQRRKFVSAGHLMRMQSAFDLAQARRQEKALKVKRYRRRPQPTAA